MTKPKGGEKIKMKIFTGKVISTKMQKTATVAVTNIWIHPVYKKRTRRIKKYHVHDDFGVNVGQQVKFVACRPISKTKKWKIISTDNADEKKISPKKKSAQVKKSKPASVGKTTKNQRKSAK